MTIPIHGQKFYVEQAKYFQWLSDENLQKELVMWLKATRRQRALVESMRRGKLDEEEDKLTELENILKLCRMVEEKRR